MNQNSPLVLLTRLIHDMQRLQYVMAIALELLLKESQINSANTKRAASRALDLEQARIALRGVRF